MSISRKQTRHVFHKQILTFFYMGSMCECECFTIVNMQCNILVVQTFSLSPLRMIPPTQPLY